MKMEALPFPGLYAATFPMHSDARGAFGRLFCERELASVLAGRGVQQVNLSRTSIAGTVRGLHFQHPPHAEMKMIRCLRGRVWDVTVDLRAGSPTFLRWHAEELSAASGRMLIVPEGCAHGFQVLEPESELLYLHTACYAPQAEGGVHPLEPRLGIRWPLPVQGLSERDGAHPALADFAGIAS